MAPRTRAAISAISAISAGPGDSEARSSRNPRLSSLSCRSHRRATFSAIPQNQAPKRSGDRRRSRLVIAATVASCAASRARWIRAASLSGPGSTTPT
jgi:hypothetical protein